MPISREEVDELALLARLRLGDEEAERLRADLTQILAYVEKLRGVPTAGVLPMTHAVPMDCPLRDDQVAPPLSPDEALAGAPERVDDFFAVPKFVDK